MSKIAPVLHDVVEEISRLGFGYTGTKARAELRALLACVRALEDGINGCNNMRPDSECRCPGCRALARLSRAGRGRGK